MAKKKVNQSETEELTQNESTKDQVSVSEKSASATPVARIAKKHKKKDNKSQKYVKVLSHVIKGKFYPLSEAIKLVKETAIGKFNPTIETHFNLGLDVTKDEQKVRTTVVPPNGTGKERKVLAFVPMESIKGAKEAGADIIGDDAKIEEIAKGTIDFDVVVADPSFMARLSKVARILGPKGLMPNPKSGTVTSDSIKAIKDLKKGKIELKTETNAPLLHTIIGKKSFTDSQLLENFMAVYNTLKAAKPSKTKGTYIEAVTLSSTMGPGIKVDLLSISQ